MRSIVCSRFGEIIPQLEKSNKVHSVFKRNFVRRTPLSAYEAVGIDKNEIVFASGDCHALIPFFSSIKKKIKIIVLTVKEFELIAKCGFIHNIDVICFEKEFPFVCNIFFINNAKENLKNLSYYIHKVRKIGIELSYIQDFCKKVNSKVIKKIPKINDLDKNFFFIPNFGYQEVFQLKEESPDRKIIAFDYNSMYANAMKGHFPNPRNLFYEKVNNYIDKKDSLLEGMYHVILSEPDEFIKKYNALRYVWQLKSFPIELTGSFSIDTLLTKDEVDYYKLHFKKVFIVEKIVSNDTISHPLVKNVDILFNQRLHFKNHNNNDYANLCKLYLTILHSVSNPSFKITKYFLSSSELISFIEKHLYISKPQEMTDSCFLENLNNNQLTVEDSISGIKLTYPDKNSLKKIYSLYSYVIARSRVMMMKTIELLLSVNSVHICYCNIDSIHVSVNKEKHNDLLDLLRSNNLIGQKLGQLKIECEADKGYWICPGKYWLIKDNRIATYKNICLFNKFNHDNVEMFRTVIFQSRDSNLLVPQKISIKINDTYSMRKETDEKYFYRFKDFQFKNEVYHLYRKLKARNLEVFKKTILSIKHQVKAN